MHSVTNHNRKRKRNSSPTQHGVYVITAHGRMKKERFTVPADKRIVYITPPACTAKKVTTWAMLDDPATVEKILDPATTAVNNFDGRTQYMHHIAPGETTQDISLTFKHDLGLTGVYKLPLHHEVLLCPVQSLAAVDEKNIKKVKNALRVQALANNHRVMKNAYSNIGKIRLRDLLPKVGPGTYVIQTCRACSPITETSTTVDPMARATTLNKVPSVYNTELRNFQTKAGLSNEEMKSIVNLNGGVRVGKGWELGAPATFLYAAKRYKNLRRHVTKHRIIPSFEPVYGLVRNTPQFALLAPTVLKIKENRNKQKQQS